MNQFYFQRFHNKLLYKTKKTLVRMSAFNGDVDEEPKVVAVKTRDSQFAEAFDIKTGMRIETTGNEEPKDTEKEKAILRRQSIVVMEQATNYTGYNVKI